jgi:protein-tyrosine kinase
VSSETKGPAIKAMRRDSQHVEVVAASAVKAEVSTAELIGLSDTVVFRHPVIALDQKRRERERILPAGEFGATGQAYKLLRTQVMRRMRELKTNALGIFSASGDEGRTLTAINLAIAIAADLNHTALLIDLDLRRPSLHRRFGFEPEAGIEDCLQEQRPIYEAMVKIANYERLTLVPARAPVTHSSELISSQRMGDLVQELRARYYNRIIIFDLPPVLAADDALAFSRYLQAGLLVVAESKSTRSDVTRSIELLNHLTLVGTVLNASSERTRPSY